MNKFQMTLVLFVFAVLSFLTFFSIPKWQLSDSPNPWPDIGGCGSRVIVRHSDTVNTLLPGNDQIFFKQFKGGCDGPQFYTNKPFANISDYQVKGREIFTAGIVYKRPNAQYVVTNHFHIDSGYGQKSNSTQMQLPRLNKFNIFAYGKENLFIHNLDTLLQCDFSLQVEKRFFLPNDFTFYAVKQFDNGFYISGVFDSTAFIGKHLNGNSGIEINFLEQRNVREINLFETGPGPTFFLSGRLYSNKEFFIKLDSLQKAVMYQEFNNSKIQQIYVEQDQKEGYYVINGLEYTKTGIFHSLWSLKYKNESLVWNIEHPVERNNLADHSFHYHPKSGIFMFAINFTDRSFCKQIQPGSLYLTNSPGSPFTGKTSLNRNVLGKLISGHPPISLKLRR